MHRYHVCMCSNLFGLFACECEKDGDSLSQSILALTSALKSQWLFTITHFENLLKSALTILICSCISIKYYFIRWSLALGVIQYVKFYVGVADGCMYLFTR